MSQDVNDTVESASDANDIESKITILEEGILNQENEIFLASNALIPKLVLKDQCQNVSEADRSKLIRKCQSTVQDI